ncbi:MAG: hypothetical protein N2C14_32290 [Planctomycetales bacterium]
MFNTTRNSAADRIAAWRRIALPAMLLGFSSVSAPARGQEASEESRPRPSNELQFNISRPVTIIEGGILLGLAAIVLIAWRSSRADSQRLRSLRQRDRRTESREATDDPNEETFPSPDAAPKSVWDDPFFRNASG